LAPFCEAELRETMPHKNERVELAIKLMAARQRLARSADNPTRERTEALIAELEQKLREIDE
jgi:hypothetical protein